MEEKYKDMDWRKYYKENYNLTEEKLNKMPNKISSNGFITGMPKEGIKKTAVTMSHVLINYIYYNPIEVTRKYVHKSHQLDIKCIMNFN